LILILKGMGQLLEMAVGETISPDASKEWVVLQMRQAPAEFL
jgi:hypothetical protein